MWESELQKPEETEYVEAGVASRAASTAGINYGWEVVFAAYPHLFCLLNSQIRTFDSHSSDF